MRTKDTFFICLFTMTFLVCGTIIMGNHLSRQVERGLLNIHVQAKGEKEEPDMCVLQSDYTDKVAQSEREDICDNQVIQESAELCKYENESIFQEEATGNAESTVLIADRNFSESEPVRTESLEQSTVETQLEMSETEMITEIPENMTYQTVDYAYFEDALFIGDSRMVGIMEYGNIEKGTFFVDTGMTVFDLDKKKVTIGDQGKIGFAEVLENRQYGKIYLMLGINELGYRFENIEAKYQDIVEKIRTYQPDAIIYLCANMHVTEEQSAKDTIYNNTNVNRVNGMISELADNETIFYIDVNEVFDDAGGNLDATYSSDAFHVYGKHYQTWVDWLCTKAII